MRSLKRRREFLRLREAPRHTTPAFVLQGAPRPPSAQRARCARPSGLEQAHPGDETARFGFTVSRRIGNAVKRNRAKRRLRELVRRIAPAHVRTGYDYVLIARPPALERSFRALERDLVAALRRVHAKNDRIKDRLSATPKGRSANEDARARH